MNKKTMNRWSCAAFFLGTAVLLSVIVGPLPRAAAQLEDLVAAAKPSVVVILTKKQSGQTGHGSGFLFHPSGYILTNQHVVEGAAEMSVLLSDRRRLPATVVDYARRLEFTCPPMIANVVDVAVLKVEGEGFPVLALGDSDTLRQGQEIIIMGFPGGVGIDQVSVTRGIVGAIRGSWVQTDAVMLPGNSGGPAMDRAGRVIGLATFGTGPGLRIGGLVAANSIKAMAAAATTPGTVPIREFRVTGMEYAGPLVVGRRLTYRSTVQGLAEFTWETTAITNLAGALSFQRRSTVGHEVSGILNADGIAVQATSGRGWVTKFPESYSWMKFPACPGQTWQTRGVAEHAGDRITRHLEITTRIEAVGESLSLASGTYSQLLRIGEVWNARDVKGNTVNTFRNTMTEWWAPGIGLVRLVEEAANARWVTDLISHFSPAAP